MSELKRDEAVPRSPCPYCGHVMDRATNSGSAHARPTPGDLSVCILCAGYLKFDEGLRLVKLPDAELKELSAADQAQLMRVRQAIVLTKSKLFPARKGRA